MANWIRLSSPVKFWGSYRKSKATSADMDITMDKATAKKIILERFNANVRGMKYDPAGYNAKHDGAGGHWLENAMGLKPNGNNAPDFEGYEMKNYTSKKTTFGDWSPDECVWGKVRPSLAIPKLDRDNQFLRYFGKANLKKDGRYSWSGEPAPKIGAYNKFGQVLQVDGKENILALYSYDRDSRDNKAVIIPEHLKINNLMLARWTKESISKKVEKKFNDKGWFKCFKNGDGVYDSIGFGDPIKYIDWVELVRTGVVFFDSGMYAGNKRPYAQWRAMNNYWDALVKERH